MQFNVLGSVELQVSDETVRLGGIHQRATLAYLLLNANRTVSTNRLVEAIWGQTPPATARKMLHNAVSGLRQRIAEADVGSTEIELLTRAPGYFLRVPDDQVDLLQFRALSARGRAQLAAGAWLQAARSLRDALSLWRGPAFADLPDIGIDWPERELLEKARMAAFEDWVEAQLALGRHQEIAHELETAWSADPARERMCGQLMVLLYRSGRQTDALDVFRRARSALLSEYGLDPSPELQKLEQAILNHDEMLAPSLAVPLESSPARTPASMPVQTVMVEPEGISERKWVSVLLVRAESVSQVDDDPETLAERASELQEIIGAEVGVFGGILYGRMGTVWQAVFGLDRTHEDDAERAIRAAWSIRHRFELTTEGPITARTRVSIAGATGEALVTSRSVDPAEVTGEMIDGCMRQLGVLRSGEVRVCAMTRRASRGAVTYAASGEVVGVRPEHESATFSGPFLGRTAELEMLNRLLSEVARTSRPQSVTLFGEPGIGKSRLVREFRARVGGEVQVFVGRTPRFGWNAPVTALAGVVKECCGIGADDHASAALRKLIGTVHGLVKDARTAEWMVTTLRPLVELCVRSPSHIKVEQVADAWIRFVEKCAMRGPLVLVFEDLQTADIELLDFVEALDRRLGPVPVLVVATARTELVRRRPAWGGESPTTTARTISPLSEAEIRELVRLLDQKIRHKSRLDVLASGAGLPPLACDAELVTLVGGNPLFASEYVQMLRADLRYPDPAVPTLVVPSAAVGETGSARLPQSVHTIMAARLDTLPQREKSVLQAAAMIGSQISAGGVAEMSKLDRAEIAVVLTLLERHGFLVRNGRRLDTGELVYSFHQPILRDVAVSQLRRRDRLVRRIRFGGRTEASVPSLSRRGLARVTEG